MSKKDLAVGGYEGYYSQILYIFLFVRLQIITGHQTFVLTKFLSADSNKPRNSHCEELGTNQKSDFKNLVTEFCPFKTYLLVTTYTNKSFVLFAED